MRACFVTGLLKWQTDETPAAILWVSRAAGATSRAGVIYALKPEAAAAAGVSISAGDLGKVGFGEVF